MKNRSMTWTVVVLAMAAACSSGNSNSVSRGSGGMSSAGGTGAASGGTSGAAGSGAGGTSSASGGVIGNSGGAISSGGVVSAGGVAGAGGVVASGGRSGAAGSGGASSLGGAGGTSAAGGVSNGGSTGAAGTIGAGGAASGGTGAGSGGTTSSGGVTATGGVRASGGAGGGQGGSASGGSVGSGGSSGSGGSVGSGGSSGSGGSVGSGGSSGSGGSTCSGPIGTFTGALSTGITFTDDQGNSVNAHGGGIIKEGGTYYMHGEYFLSTTTDNNFNGFSMYSSKDLSTWKWEGMILPQQASGQLGPNRKGERPHIIKCPSTGEFVLYAHSADVTYQADKEVVYATSSTVNGTYTFQGSLTNSSGTIAAHSDMSALTDGSKAYVVTESGHVYTLSTDCHNWVSDNTYSAVNGDSGGAEAPTVFKAGSTYYWIGSYKTGWRANNNFYSTASAMTGPWTFQGFVAPVTDTSTVTASGQPNPPEWISDQRTWLSQTTWVTPVEGCNGTTYVFWGDHWNGDESTTAPGKHNYLATYVFQPLVFTGTAISMPTYLSSWKLDVGAGTWSQ